MATHSSILAREIPWTEAPGGLEFTGLQRAGYILVTEQQHLYDEMALKHNTERNSIKQTDWVT